MYAFAPREQAARMAEHGREMTSTKAQSVNRRAAPWTRANIRIAGVRLNDDDRADIRRRLGKLFARYSQSVERVTVRVRDVNGPRGGIDVLCRIKVVLRRIPSVVVEHRTAHLRSSLNKAFAAAERAVSRNLQRRRTRPLKIRGARKASR
jgi:phosphoglycerate-specific signal transduction histidine kinase